MKDTKDGFRVVVNPEAQEKDVKVFPAEGTVPDVEPMVEAETRASGALLYTVDSYEDLVLFLNNTDTVKDIQDVRLCAAGRGYVRYVRKGDGGFPPEDAVRRVMASAPSLPKPQSGLASLTIHQDAEHPEGVVVKPGADRETDGRGRRNRAGELGVDPDTVDRFISCYMALGGTFDRLADRLEEVLKWTSSTR